MLIARLIADKAQLETRLAQAISAIEATGMAIADAQMMDTDGDVLEIAVTHDDAMQLKQCLLAQFSPCDLLVTRDVPVVPQLFISDMDSTMIGQECIDELADFAGLKERISAITERAMLGELDFESALRERVGLLQGLEESAISRCLEERIEPMPGARILVGTLKAKGCRTVLVTGGFHHFADPVASWLGFDRVVGNHLAVEHGKLTGALAGPITDSSVKEQVLRDESDKLGVGTISMATGDGANDIPMLQAADYGIAYHAKPKAQSAANGAISLGDLTSVLRLLDIPREEWSESAGFTGG